MQLTENDASKITAISLAVKAFERSEDPCVIVHFIIKNCLDPLLKLYLMDSIMKTVGGVYIDVIGARILPVFIETFRQVDVEVRKKLFHLRQSWNSVLLPKTLFENISHQATPRRLRTNKSTSWKFCVR